MFNLLTIFFFLYIYIGTKAGDFCYKLDGTRGHVDYYLKDVPINVECDPRLSCANSVDKNCPNVPGMTDILVRISKHPMKSVNCNIWSLLLSQNS